MSKGQIIRLMNEVALPTPMKRKTGEKLTVSWTASLYLVHPSLFVYKSWMKGRDKIMVD